jgi:D-glycero-beta-D-manno-heptose 1-phosphate adenylyltransferase
MSPLRQIHNKLYELATLKKAIAEWKAAVQKIVFTNGCFDILHPGHIDYLAKAAALGNKLIIGLNSDSSVQKLKGPHRPIQDEQARAMLLGALAFVDAIVVFKEDTPAELIAELLPDVLVKGADYSVEQIAGGDTVIGNGGSVVLLPYLKGYSTSGIEKRIKQRTLE